MDNDTADFIKTIIWVLIFFLWAGWQFFKKLTGIIKKDAPPQSRKNKKQAVPRKKTKAIGESLRDFFEEITKAQKAGKPESPPPPKKPKAVSAPRKKQQTPAAVSAPAQQPAALFSEEILPHLSAEDMRQAVIFSEILGAPLALRDTDDRPF
ncbi:MAG: hypothetical protein BWK80_26475 [Desulfobacteraceae bacterium IS3]|nr:MAG: hypothetical protein BWK80_26475 [Desulfobacteraceae bacterium IS3]